MTTQKQIRSALRSVLSSEKDLHLVGRNIYIAPITHVARCISFEKLSNPDTFRLRWHVNHLFGKLHASDSIWGRHLLDGENGYTWKWSSPSLEEDIFEAITKTALPKLRCVSDIEMYTGMVNFIDSDASHWFVDQDDVPSEQYLRDCAQKGYPTRFPGDRALIFLASGLFEKAKKMTDAIAYFDVKKLPKYTFPLPGIEFFFDILCPLIREGDRHKILTLLMDLEEEKIRYHKLEKIWQPTPFPLEQMA